MNLTKKLLIGTATVATLAGAFVLSNSVGKNTTTVHATTTAASQNLSIAAALKQFANVQAFDNWLNPSNSANPITGDYLLVKDNFSGGDQGWEIRPQSDHSAIVIKDVRSGKVLESFTPNAHNSASVTQIRAALSARDSK